MYHKLHHTWLHRKHRSPKWKQVST
jgi:hypothetical protein